MKTGRGNSKTLIPVLLFVALISRPAQAQTYTVLHDFAGKPSDGAWASGELIQNAAGNLYGTTYEGGRDNLGFVFKLDQSGVVTILHNFTGRYDGAHPEGGLLRNAKGAMFGTTTTGGDNGGGTVFRLDTSNTLKTLFSFNNVGDGVGRGPSWLRSTGISTASRQTAAVQTAAAAG